MDDPNEVKLLDIDWGPPVRASATMESVPGVVIHVQLNEHWWITEVRIEATTGHIGAKELRALALQKIARAIGRAESALRPCMLCHEPLGADAEDGQAHRECLLRSALGGIGHHEDHAYWCVEMGDPDGGRSFRDSAREVMALLAEIGPDQLARQAMTFD